MRVKKSRKIIDLGVLVLLVVLASILTVAVHVSFLSSIFLFFVIPSAYLMYRKPSNFKKAIVGGVLLGIVWGFAFDFIAEYNGAWSWSARNSLVFPKLLLGTVSLDILVWFFFWIFLVIAFYEYFIEYDFDDRISKRVIASFSCGVITDIFLIFLYKYFPIALEIKYAYLVLGLVTLLPFFYVIVRRPSLIPKLMAVLPFFIFLYLSYELAALSIGLWDFPGQYLGTIQLLHLTFPLEEFVFWILISGAVVAAYHELYIDDFR